MVLSVRENQGGNGNFGKSQGMPGNIGEFDSKVWK